MQTAPSVIDPQASPQTPDALRKHHRAARMALGAARREQAATAVIPAVLALLQAAAAREVAAYVAVGSEFDPAPLLLRLQALGCRLWLPCLQAEDQALQFRPRPDDPTQMQHNRHGIPEPVSGPLWPAARLDALLLPLLAFDRHGTRLGAGGGYYDRTLAGCGPARPLRIGLAFACQQAPLLPRRAWDQPLHHVCTEQEHITCPPLTPS